MQEMWDTTTWPNLWIIIRVEEEESQVNDIEWIFNKVIEGNFLKLRKHIHRYKKDTEHQLDKS